MKMYGAESKRGHLIHRKRSPFSSKRRLSIRVLRREVMGQATLIGSFWAVVWLLSAIEFGAAGFWAMWCIAGIVIAWAGTFAYANWQEREKERRQERKRERLAKRIMAQAEKEFYLRNVA